MRDAHENAKFLGILKSLGVNSNLSQGAVLAPVPAAFLATQPAWPEIYEEPPEPP